VVCDDGEVSSFQHVAEIPHGLIDGQQLPVIGAVFLLRRAELPGEESEGLPDILYLLLEDSPMAVVEASITKASVAIESGCARRAARDRLALHSSKALSITAIQVMGYEPLTLGPEKASWRGAWREAALGRKRL
jgi:hypothetical protein